MLNCVVDQRYDDAHNEAAAADELIKSGQYTVEELATLKPFLGVPITTKDCIAVKGEVHTKNKIQLSNVINISIIILNS